MRTCSDLTRVANPSLFLPLKLLPMTHLYPKAVVGLIPVLAFVGVIVKMAIVGGEHDFLPHAAPLYRLVITLGLIIALIWLMREMFAYMEKQIKAEWFRIGLKGHETHLSWQDVFTTISLDENDREAKGAEGIKDHNPKSIDVIVSVMACIALGLLFSICFDYVIFPHTPKLISLGTKDPLGALVNASGNLTAYLALIAATVSIFFAYFQLRARVRAESRQRWIDGLRKLMAQVIADIIECDDGILSNKANKRRVELELMVNPSENDHRLFCFLVRAFIVPALRIEVDSRTKVDIARANISTTEETKLLYDITQFNIIVASVEDGDIPDGARKASYVERNDAISYMIRLSQVILKREWERVKYIR